MRKSILIAAAGLFVASIAVAGCSNETNEPQTTGSVPQSSDVPPPAMTEQPPAGGEQPATTTQ